MYIRNPKRLALVEQGQCPKTQMTQTGEDYESATDDEVYFSPEDELDLLRSNQLAMTLGTVLFLQSRGISPSEWARELGEIFARGWDTAEAWTAEDFLDATIVNLSVLGGEVTQAEFAEDDASAIVSYLPDRERVEGMGLDEVNGDLIYEMVAPIARACGLSWSWVRDGEVVRVRVSSLEGEA